MTRPEPPRVGRWVAVWQRFWTLPSAIAAVSLGLGLGLPYVDQALGGEHAPAWLFQGGVDGARSLLSSIVGAMISVTGLVFSITIVTLQLASSQFSPRVLGAFLDSRIVQVTLGVFTGSFLYALAVLRAVRGGETIVVPHLSVTASLLYVLAAVGMFLAFIHHITESIRVTTVMREVRENAVATVRRLTADVEPAERTASWSPRPGTPRTEIRFDDRVGYVRVIDGGGLARLGRDHDLVVQLDVAPGDFLAPGQPIGSAWGHQAVPDEVLAAVVGALEVGDERSSFHDIAFGLRQLLDIAERALSPGVNDPTTALQAINEMWVVLRCMAQCPDPSPYLVEDGEVRAVYRAQKYADMLTSVVDELRAYGWDAPRVPVRVRELLDDLAGVARPEHRSATEAQRARLDEPT